MDKVYLITGAASDVGMTYMKKLNSSGEKIKVYACIRKETNKFSELKETCSNLEIIPMISDLSEAGQTEKMLKDITESGVYPTHILHLAAASFDYMKIKKWDSKRVHEEMEITFHSFAAICNVFLPLMAKNKAGKVVAMLSSYTLGTPPKFMGDYVACKYALLGYIKSAAAEYASKGININGISPGMMETKFLEKLDDRVIEMTAAASLMGRNTEVEETCDAIEFLMSEKSSYLNGVNLNLSGGDYMP